MSLQKKEMTAKEFNVMCTDDRASFLWDHCIFIADRLSRTYLVKVYALLDLYVEVYYDIEDNKIKDIYAIETEEDWDVFLKHIDLKEVY